MQPHWATPDPAAQGLVLRPGSGAWSAGSERAALGSSPARQNFLGWSRHSRSGLPNRQPLSPCGDRVLAVWPPARAPAIPVGRTGTTATAPCGRAAVGGHDSRHFTLRLRPALHKAVPSAWARAHVGASRSSLRPRQGALLPQATALGPVTGTGTNPKQSIPPPSQGPMRRTGPRSSGHQPGAPGTPRAPPSPKPTTEMTRKPFLSRDGHTPPMNHRRRVMRGKQGRSGWKWRKERPRWEGGRRGHS